ncbi:potassium-transporting ATPase subunit C [Streptococcus pseudoporcinus]|uniref:Potassium-transporting ATPase KdpC subunit n=1 Tax=Streptococcus pseudoporcinus TaxID=361101 RepID=A0A4U9YEL4_9STRE|nr:potassium-transporting ATPase subunit KdpC [Streptococcus pseudoporcinus]VTS24554.1 potassium-transporting ATPase subunit C [Streptococcus pseudoporcinus]
MTKICSYIKRPVRLTLLFGAVCGIIYPLLITGLGQFLFPFQANGSQIKLHEEPIGTALIGQEFSSAAFLHGRPSAIHYNTYSREEVATGQRPVITSGSQNLAPSNPKLKARVQQELALFLKENPTVSVKDIPADLVTTSGSGLDPEISPESAKLQIPRIARKTGISPSRLEKIINAHTATKVLGFLGEDRVSVLEVNLAIKKELNQHPFKKPIAVVASDD